MTIEIASHHRPEAPVTCYVGAAAQVMADSLRANNALSLGYHPSLGITVTAIVE